MDKFPRIFLDTLWSLVTSTGRILTTPAYLRPAFRLCDKRNISPENVGLIVQDWDLEKQSDLLSPDENISRYGPFLDKAEELSRIYGGDMREGKIVLDARTHFDVLMELEQMKLLCATLQNSLNSTTFQQDASTQTTQEHLEEQSTICPEHKSHDSSALKIHVQ